MNKILITGANGYIGYCLFKYLKKKNLNISGVDLSNSRNKLIKKLDLCNYKSLKNYLKVNKPDIIVHLGGYSTIDKIEYKKRYIKNNTLATKTLLKAMVENDIKNIIFSSTAAVYDYKSNINFFSENSKKNPKTIYGRTKLQCEKMITNNNKMNFIIFRFFNVCSSINRLRVGENHRPETHLIPLSIKNLIKKIPIKIYGSDYETKDGTCIRDYIHIADICDAFYKSIFFIKKKRSTILNLGSSKGFSVKQIINSIIKISKEKNFKIKIFPRRKGDVPKLVCSNKLAKKLLNWTPKNSYLDKIIKDEITWQKFIK